MPVKIEYKETASTDAWRWDWPAVPAINQTNFGTVGVERYNW